MRREKLDVGLLVTERCRSFSLERSDAMSLGGRGSTMFLGGERMRHSNSSVQGGFVIPEAKVIRSSQGERMRQESKGKPGAKIFHRGKVHGM